MFRYLPLILKNSWRNRRRTTLTILSISVSLCLLGVLMAIYHAFYMSEASPSQAPMSRQGSADAPAACAPAMVAATNSAPVLAL